MNTEPIDLEFMGAREMRRLSRPLLRPLWRASYYAAYGSGVSPQDVQQVFSTHEHPGFKKPLVRAHAPNG